MWETAAGVLGYPWRASTGGGEDRRRSPLRGRKTEVFGDWKHFGVCMCQETGWGGVIIPLRQMLMAKERCPRTGYWI